MGESRESDTSYQIPSRLLESFERVTVINIQTHILSHYMPNNKHTYAILYYHKLFNILIHKSDFIKTIITVKLNLNLITY